MRFFAILKSRERTNIGVRVRPLGLWQWRTALVIIGTIALGLRCFYVMDARVDHPIRGDAVQYYSEAWNIVNHDTFSISKPGEAHVVADSYRDPGFPLFISLWLKSSPDSGDWYGYLLLCQAALGSLTVLLLMNAAREWLPDRWIVGAGVLMAVWPHSIVMCSYLLTETLVGFLCALATYLLSLMFLRKHVGAGAFSGLLFGAAACTNAVLLPFAWLLMVALWLSKSCNRKTLLVLAFASTLLPALWSIRNWQLPPSNTSSSGRAVINLVQGSWPDYHSAWRNSLQGDPSAAATLLNIQSEYTTMQADRMAGAALISKRLFSNPTRYLLWYLSKPYLLWEWDIRIGQGDIYVYPTLYSPFSYNAAFIGIEAVCETINPILFLLGIAGSIFALTPKARLNAPISTASAALAIYVTMIYSLLQSEPRYSIPFRGFEILLATSGAYQIISWVTTKRASFARPNIAEL